MNIGFYDPITERWIKPRPEREPEAKPTVSMGEALLIAMEEKARQERNAKIWEYLKQSAEGCNSIEASPIVTTDPPEYAEPQPATQDWLVPGQQSPWQSSLPAPEYEIAESLGYVYWKPKD